MSKLPWAVSAIALLSTAVVADEPNKGKAGVEVKEFGKMPDGTPVKIFTLTNSTGASAKIMELGGIITELYMPDNNGKLDDIVLGFDNLEAYLNPKVPYFGAITGRVANRIAKGKFTLDGKEYTLDTNNGVNHLHGGKKGFDKVVWHGEAIKADSPAVKFHYRSPDGEEGYPGNLTVEVTYTLTDANELKIDYLANTDKATPINLTNHTYFNLLGVKGGDISGHELAIEAEKYTSVDDTLVPTGKTDKVKGTNFDFTKPIPVGKHLKEIKADPVGYDLNYVLKSGGKKLALAARVTEPTTGRIMEVLTTEPGIQLYTGNFLDGTLTGKSGTVYKQHTAICLETQHFPDSVNHKEFPSTILKPGTTFKSTTVYKFTAK
jgi:aldose 1-epimerase